MGILPKKNLFASDAPSLPDAQLRPSAGRRPHPYGFGLKSLGTIIERVAQCARRLQLVVCPS